MKTKEITQEMFNEVLVEILKDKSADTLLNIEGIYEILAEKYNDKILKKIEVGQIKALAKMCGATV